MCPFIFLLALLMGLIFSIFGATFVQLLRVINIGLSNFQTDFLKLFANLCNKCYNTHVSIFSQKKTFVSKWRQAMMKNQRPEMATALKKGLKSMKNGLSGLLRDGARKGFISESVKPA